jgi:acylphosphatase
MKAVRVRIDGHVQGVGFRYWVEREARRRGLSGWVRNRKDGSVEAVLSGEDASVDDMLDACRRGPQLARVDGIEAEPAAPDEAGADFRALPTA